MDSRISALDHEKLKPGDLFTARDTDRYLVADQQYEVVETCGDTVWLQTPAGNRIQFSRSELPLYFL